MSNWWAIQLYVHNLGANMESTDILQSQKMAKKLVSVGILKQFRIHKDWLFQQIPAFLLSSRQIFKTKMRFWRLLLENEKKNIQYLIKNALSCNILTALASGQYRLFRFVWKTLKMVHFGSWLKYTPWHFRNWCVEGLITCGTPLIQSHKPNNVVRYSLKRLTYYPW